MKKLTTLLTALALLAAPTMGSAQLTGKASSASSNVGSNGSFVWPIAVGAVAVFATVVGITVASATTTPSTYSH